MSYSQFETLEQTLDAFDLTPIEAKFFPHLSPIVPSDLLTTFLKRSVPIDNAFGKGVGEIVCDRFACQLAFG